MHVFLDAIYAISDIIGITSVSFGFFFFFLMQEKSII